MGDEEEVKGSVRLHLQRDLLATDFLTSLFWAAMSSFRHDTILRPFPPMFLSEEGHKDISGVVRCPVRVHLTSMLNLTLCLSPERKL